MICTTLIVSGDGVIDTGKRYDCINGVCVENAGGQYTEPTCAGACKKKDDTSKYIIIGAGVLALALLFGGKK